MLAFIRRAAQAYGRIVLKRPLLFQVATAGTLVTTGDLIAQSFIEKKKKHDFRRTAIMATCGFMYFGPVVGVWLSLLNRWGYSTVVNVMLDQALFAPMIISGFFTIQSLLNGKTVLAAGRRVKAEVPGVLVVGWTVWIPTQIINFQFMPFQYRMLLIQVVALFWNSYLSLQANRTQIAEESLESDTGKSK